MAGLRHGRPNCIRAAFSATSASATPRAGLQKREWSMLRRIKASHIKNFVEGIRREFLDPSDGEADDAPGPLRGGCCSAPVARAKGAEATSEEAVRAKCSDLVSRSARGAPEVADVDMQPVEASSPEPRGWAAWPCVPLADAGLREEWGPPDAGRPAQARARVSPRASRPLKLTADKGLKLARNKRKLELLLAEPERGRKKQLRAA